MVEGLLTVINGAYPFFFSFIHDYSSFCASEFFLLIFLLNTVPAVAPPHVPCLCTLSHLSQCYHSLIDDLTLLLPLKLNFQYWTNSSCGRDVCSNAPILCFALTSYSSVRMQPRGSQTRPSLSPQGTRPQRRQYARGSTSERTCLAIYYYCFYRCRLTPLCYTLCLINH